MLYYLDEPYPGRARPPAHLWHFRRRACHRKSIRGWRGGGDYVDMLYYYIMHSICQFVKSAHLLVELQFWDAWLTTSKAFARLFDLLVSEYNIWMTSSAIVYTLYSNARCILLSFVKIQQCNRIVWNLLTSPTVANCDIRHHKLTARKVDIKLKRFGVIHFVLIIKVFLLFQKTLRTTRWFWGCHVSMICFLWCLLLNWSSALTFLRRPVPHRLISLLGADTSTDRIVWSGG